jgi:8-oxo-dGTP diphosphatase
MNPQHVIGCPVCGHAVSVRRNPLLTVDVIIRLTQGGIVLIERKNPPYGWALPGGFVDYGESLEAAACREAKEETGLELEGLQQFRAYSDPARDPRHHTVTVVFTATGKGSPRADDDAKQLGVFSEQHLPVPIVFDHARILADYFAGCSKPCC